MVRVNRDWRYVYCTSGLLMSITDCPAFSERSKSRSQYLLAKVSEGVLTLASFMIPLRLLDVIVDITHDRFRTMIRKLDRH